MNLMALQPISVKVVQHFSVAPPPESTTSAAPTSLNLTFFDLRWLRFTPTNCLYFYEFPDPTTSFYDSILPKLKHSLSLTLQQFLPLAGKLTWPHDSHVPIVNYVPGDAVSFTIANSDSDFSDVFGTTHSEHKKYYSLAPNLTISDNDAALIALQITVFPNSWFCIGMTTHHAVLDGRTASLFLKLWSYICSNLGESSSPIVLPEHLVPFYDRTKIIDPSGITEIYVNDLIKLGGRSLALSGHQESEFPAEATRAKFEMTQSHIEKLKQSVLSKLKQEGHSSTFSVTCAYVWFCLAKAKEIKTKKANFVISMDCRGRLDQIPAAYFGNCVARRIAVAETKSLLGDDGFCSALKAINLVLNRLGDGLLDGAETWLSLPLENETFLVAGSPRFQLYDMDFGWGRPKKVEMTSLSKTQKPAVFLLSERRNHSGGVEIELVLKKHEMESFASLFVNGFESL